MCLLELLYRTSHVLHAGARAAVLRWLIGWLFGFNGPLRQYFILYRTVSQREGERGERVKMSKQSLTRTYCKLNRPLPFYHPNSRTPRPGPSHHPTTPAVLPLNCINIRILPFLNVFICANIGKIKKSNFAILRTSIESTSIQSYDVKSTLIRC